MSAECKGVCCKGYEIGSIGYQGRFYYDKPLVLFLTCMIHLCLYLEILGLVLRHIPQQGQNLPSQFTNISQTLHLF